MGNVQIVSRGQQVDQLGEGVTWSPRRQAIFWVDILAPALNMYDLGTGVVSRWPMPERIGWLIEREGRDDFIIGLKSGIATLQLSPLTITHIVHPEPERLYNRLNDAKVDSRGRIWFGSKDDRDMDASGALYRLDTNMSCSRHDDDYAITNGPTFSVDGRLLYHTDSAARTVYVFDLDAAGHIHHKRIFTIFEESWGYPDGMTTDAEGYLWIAHWGAGRVSRFTPDGELQRSIPLPTPQITNCAFGGENLDRMFITSAAAGVSSSPEAGALFEIDPGCEGIAGNLFAG